MFFILSFPEDFIEQTVTRQWAPRPACFVCRLRTWCVPLISGIGGAPTDPPVTRRWFPTPADLVHVSLIWSLLGTPIGQSQPDGAPILLRMCVQAADLVRVSHLKLPQGTHCDANVPGWQKCCSGAQFCLNHFSCIPNGFKWRPHCA